MKCAGVLAILFAVLSLSAISQELFENEILAVHPKIGGVYNQYLPNFSQFQGSVDCGVFGSGGGYGIQGGLAIERVLSPKFQLSLGATYVDRSGEMVVGSSFKARGVDGDAVDVLTDNILTIDASFLEISPDLRFAIVKRVVSGPLRLFAGPRISVPLSANFDQKEKIKSPDYYVFTDDGLQTKTRAIAGGDISSINSLIYGASFGLDHLMKAGRDNYFTQQITLDYNLNDFVSDAEWKNLAFRVDIGYRFGVVKRPKKKVVPPPPQEAPVPETPAVAEVPPPPPPPEMSVSIEDYDLKIVTGNELLATLPLVNAVFFDLNSSEIGDDYVVRDSHPDSYFFGSSVKAHSWVMPRVAQIIDNNPKARIALVGATSGEEDEPRGLELARERAESVKSVLADIGVPEDRIETRARLLPANPSNPDFPEGRAENRRVDIIVENAPLQEYVDVQKYAELRGEVKIDLFFDRLPEGTRSAINTNFSEGPIEAREGENVVRATKRISGDEPVELTVGAIADTMSRTTGVVIDPADLPKETIELNLENFVAVLRFDYDSAELSDANKGLLKQLAELLPAGATVKISGSADALGAEERNAVLTRQRAEAAERYVKSVSGDKFNIETSGRKRKFPEETPQGRFLNRSIMITVDYE